MLKSIQLRIAIVSVVALLLLAGIAAAQEQEPVTLRFAWWGSENRHTRTNQVIDLFEEQYPWINIEAEPFLSFDDYWIAMTAQATAGNAPDLIQQDYSRIEEWVKNDWVIPLDDFVEDGTIDLSNVSETNVAGGRVNDGLYAISLGTNSYGMMIDVDMFEEAGLDLPEQDWTWADFEEICMALHERLDRWCVGGYLGNDNSWTALWLGYGMLPFAPQATGLGYEDDAPLVEFLNMMLRLQEAGAIPNRAVQITVEGAVEDELIISGEAVMANIWSNQMVSVWNLAGEDRDFIMTHLPRPADGCCSQNFVKPSQFLSIAANSEHPEEAAMFIDFFTNSLEANRFLLAERGVPISSAVQEDLTNYVSTAQARIFEFLARVEADSSPLPPPDPALHAVIRDDLYGPILRDAVMFEEITPEEAAALFREQVNALLAGE